MSAESYWIERHALATGRAKQAEQDREAAIERAERVELLVRSVYLFGTGFVWKRSDGTEHVLDPAEVSVFIAADQQSEREQLAARAERAEDAIQRVTALAEELWREVADLRVFYAPRGLDRFDSGRMVALQEAHERLVAALDAQPPTAARVRDRADQIEPWAPAFAETMRRQATAALDSTDPEPAQHRPERGRLTIEVPDERGGGTVTRGALLCAICGVEWPCPDSTDPEPAPKQMSDGDEAALLARQRDDVLARCAAREADGCTYIRIADLYEAYLPDPADPTGPGSDK